MKKVYDAVVVTGEYEDRNTGEKKKRYLNVGVVLQGDKGLSLKLEALPVNFNGWINFYEPKDQTQQRPTQPARGKESAGAPFNDSDIPW